MTLRTLLLVALFAIGCRRKDDADGDGVAAGFDCDDGDASVFPDAEETCDGVDQDCDGTTDDDATGAPTWYGDLDGDGAGSAQSTTVACVAPAGTVATADDCDDFDPAAHPGGTETCDGADNDCNGTADDGGDAPTWYADEDGDGYGLDGTGTTACEGPEGTVDNGDDCDDDDASVHPGAPEIDCEDPTDRNCDGSTGYADEDDDGVAACEDCDDQDASAYPRAPETCDGTDDDCDGDVDDDATDANTWYADLDRDGHGGTGVIVVACEAPGGYAAAADDCDDLDPTAYPAAPETCDGKDDDCNGAPDDDPTDPTTYYPDSDGDGHGVTAGSVQACEPPEGYGEADDDCNDADKAVHPGAVEIDCSNPTDFNCDGAVAYVDGDGDGYAACKDCDDTAPATRPGGTEVCGGGDEDCDGLVDLDATDATTWYADIDGDGHASKRFTQTSCTQPSGYLTTADDCDDLDASAYPGGVEVCDDADNDCNGTRDDNATDVSTWWADTDSDGYGDAATSKQACDAPAAFVGNKGDCDDKVATTNPGAIETCNSVDDDCDTLVDDNAIGTTNFYQDSDKDSYGNAKATTLACKAPAGYTSNSTDCDDTRAAVNPGATEACNGIDDNCDGVLDPYGTSATCPATSCKAVLAANSSAGSADYWLDPDGKGAFKGYCDMTSPGGPYAWTVRTGLRAYWSFDGTSPANATFGSYAGTMEGAATTSTTVPATGLGRSISFNDQDTTRMLISPAVPLTANTTILFWVRHTDCSNNEIPLYLSDDVSWIGDYGFSGRMWISGTDRWLNGTNVCAAQQNRWIFAAYVDDGSALRVYSDGTLLSPTVYSYLSLNGYALMRLGNRPAFGTNGLFGQLDEVSVFDRALSAAEIQLVQQQNLAGRPLRWQ